MDRRAWFRSDDGVQVSLREDDYERASLPCVTWLTIRPEYVRPRKDNQPAVHGVLWLLFGIGTHGAAWLDRLGQSTWFAGLEPQPEDLDHGSHARGYWAMPTLGDIAHECDLATETETFVVNARLLQAWCAAIAVSPSIGPAEIAMTLGLVEALQARQGQRTRFFV